MKKECFKSANSFFGIISLKFFELKGLKMRKLLLTVLGSASLFGYMDCIKCHSANYYPLDKLTSQQISQKLYIYKKGYGIMASIARSLTEKDIKKVSLKYGKQ